MKTLFYDYDYTARYFLNAFNLVVSKNFIICADQQLSNFIELETGLKLNKNISLSFLQLVQMFCYKKGEVSTMPFNLYVNHNWNPVIIAWKSKSGLIYDVNDNDINCDDIEFWLEGIDPVLYHKQLYPKVALPFKLKDLSFDLTVTRLNIDCTMSVVLKAVSAHKIDEALDLIDSFIDEFNEKSERKGRKDGLVHNTKHAVDGDAISYEIDLGSAGPALFKKLLPFMSALNYFECVELC